MDNAHDVDLRARHAEDHAVITKNQVPVFGPEQFILWNGGAAVRHTLQRVDLLLELKHESRGIRGGIGTDVIAYLLDIALRCLRDFNPMFRGHA